MKRLLPLALLAVSAALFAGSAAADQRYYHGHGGHGYGHSHFGLYVGIPWYYPPYYPPPAYYAPSQVIVVPAPQAPTYIEQAPGYDSNQYWYYCQPANAYYPQVPNCPSNWIRVPAR